MKKHLFVLLVVSSIIAKSQSQVPVYRWAQSFGAGSFDRGNAIATDKSGNVYTTGSFAGTVDFDYGPGVFNLTAGGNDVFITKYDSTGNFIWAKSIGSVDDEIGRSIAIDTLKNIYVTGTFVSIVDFDPGVGTFTLQASLPSNSDNDAFILKLDSLGNFVWAKGIGGYNVSVVSISIKLDSQGNIYNTGIFDGTADFDPSSNNFSLTSQGSSDAYILKLDNLGDFVWAKSMGGSDNDNGNSITVDNLGNVFTVGTFAGTADLDPSSAGSYTVTASGFPYEDIFISKIDNNGNFLWTKTIGSSNSDYATSVQVDNLGDLYISGYFAGNVDFDPGISTHFLSSSSGASYVLKLNNNGIFLWVNQNLDSGPFTNVQCKSSAIDAAGNIYAAGYGTLGAFVCKLAPNGTIIWQKGYSGNGPVFVTNAICTDVFGNVYLTGVFNYQISFNNWLPGSVLVCPTVEDLFICKLHQCSQPNAPIDITNAYNLNTCAGSTTTLSVSTLDSVQWYLAALGSTAIGSGSVFITPTLSAGTTTFYAEAINCAPSASRTAITVTANPNCQYVWPGDANRDGLANNIDVLELGLHYSQTGLPRASISNNWQSYFANNWTGNPPSVNNLNNVDCNGDGIINDDDTLAIFNNYGLTHTFKPTQTTTVNPQISIVPDQALVTKGSWGTASIYMGDFNTNILDVNGTAFTVDFDNTLIDLNSIYIEYLPSYFDSGQNLHFRKLDFTNGKIFTATTHTVNNDITGSGKIATLHYQILSNLATDQVLNIGLSQANQSSASGLITSLSSGTGTLMAIGANVGINDNALTGVLAMSPNPTTDVLNILSTNDLQFVEVTNVAGQVLLKQTCIDKTQQLQLQNFVEGIYFVRVVYSNGMSVTKKVIKN